jgi:hypothetical protein
MGVFSWFRRRQSAATAPAEAGATPVGETAEGGAVAVLSPEESKALPAEPGTEQQPPPGVPAARTAPEAETAVDTPAAAVPAQPVGQGDDQDRLVPAPAEVAELLAAAVAAVPQTPEAVEEDLPQRSEQSDTGDEAMGLMDDIKSKAEQLKGKAGHLADQHHDKIEEMVDKTGEAIDKATKGKYSEKITSGAEKTKGAVGGFAEKHGKDGQDASGTADAADQSSEGSKGEEDLPG